MVNNHLAGLARDAYGNGVVAGWGGAFALQMAVITVNAVWTGEPTLAVWSWVLVLLNVGMGWRAWRRHRAGLRNLTGEPKL